MNTFGTKVAALRKGLKLSQTALAQELGTSVSVISRYERGEMTPSVATAKRIAEALRTSVAYLLADGDDADLLADRALVRRLRAVEALGPEDRERIYFTLDAVL